MKARPNTSSVVNRTNDKSGTIQNMYISISSEELSIAEYPKIVKNSNRNGDIGAERLTLEHVACPFVGACPTAAAN